MTQVQVIKAAIDAGCTLSQGRAIAVSLGLVTHTCQTAAEFARHAGIRALRDAGVPLAKAFELTR